MRQNSGASDRYGVLSRTRLNYLVSEPFTRGGAMIEFCNPGALASDNHRLVLRVYYEDTDFSGLVYHASYLRFLERGRTEWLRGHGFEQRELAAGAAMVFAVRRIEIDYLKPALMDDLLTIETQISAVGGASIDFSQVDLSRRREDRESSCRRRRIVKWTSRALAQRHERSFFRAAVSARNPAVNRRASPTRDRGARRAFRSVRRCGPPARADRSGSAGR